MSKMSVLSKRLKNRRPGRADGFTMIEVLITLLILTVVLVGLAMLQLVMIRQVTYSQRTAGATQLARLVIEKYKAMNEGAISGLEPLSTDAWAYEMLKDTTTQMKNVNASGEIPATGEPGPYTVRYYIEQVNDAGGNLDHYIITVQVSWLDITPGTDSSMSEFRELQVELSAVRYP